MGKQAVPHYARSISAAEMLREEQGTAEQARVPYITPQDIADANGQDVLEQVRRAHEEKWPQVRRDAYQQSHPENFADECTSLPISDEEDVRHAAQLYVSDPNPQQVKGNIQRIAQRLGLAAALPQQWQESDSATQHIHILDARILEQLEDGLSGHNVRVTIVAGGTSANGYTYDERALRAITRLVEGAKAYCDHDTSQVNRSVKDVVGFYHDACYVPPQADAPAGRVDATLHILETAEWLWSLIREACLLGRSDLVGLSIDIFGQWELNEATRTKEITQVVSLNSCDIVTRPSAGGSIQRILNAKEGEDDSMSDDHVVAHPGPEPAVPATLAVPSAGSAGRTGLAGPSNQGSLPGNSGLAGEHILEQQRQLEAQRVEVEQLLAEARLQRADLLLERRLQESILPLAVKEQIRTRYQGRVFEEGELDQEMTRSLQMMAQLARDGLVRGHGYEKAALEGQITEAEKIQASFDAMFDLDIDRSRLGNIRGFSSIREAYARVTGDASLFGGISGQSTLGSIRVSESAPIARITEADTTTASFSYLLGTSMNKRLLKDYQAWPAEWAKFCTIVPIRDFKQQTRVRLGAFGSLPIVAEDSAYTAVTLQDSAATYVPQKRGNLVTVSRETIINDDLQAIKQLPTKLAVAAAYTLAEFVYGFLSSNPTIYDGNPLFTSGVPHSNLGSAALSTAAMQTGITAMREQTNFAGKRLGLRPRYLVVPPELEWVSMVATKSAGVPGSNNNDINPMLGYVTPIVSPQLTSPTQWFLVGDPREIDTIEVGFVGGQVNPALFIQDQPYALMQTA